MILKHKIINLKSKILKKLDNNKYLNKYIIIILIFSLFLFSPLLFNYIYGDDSTFHAANILIRGSSIFSIFSKIVPEIGNNLGYGIGIFYPVLPHALGGLILNIISIFGLGEYAALKIVKFLVIFLSGITMYLLASKLFKNKNYGLMSSIFYISSSYFFVDMYSRDALNESFVFIFMPLIFLGIYYLFNEHDKTKFYLSFVGGYIGMMYSHLVLSVWFTIFFIIFLLLFIKDILKKENFISLITAALLILIFTSPFTVPMIEHMLNGEYIVFTREFDILTWTLQLKHFFVQIFDVTGKNNLLYTSFNIVLIILSFMTLFKLFSKKTPSYRKKYIMGFLLIIIMSIFFVCNNTIWHFTPNFLNNIQFPWRICTFAMLGISLFAAEGLDIFYNLFKKKFIPIASFLIIVIIVSNTYYNIQNIQLVKSLPYNIVDGMGWGKEYLPIETGSNLNYFNERKSNEIITNQKEVTAKIIKNEVPNMEFKVSNIKEKTTLELPRLYYLGYKIEDEDGHEIKYSKNKNGFISIVVNKEGSYYVTYPGTLGYQISKTIVIITSIVCITIIVLKKRKQNNN